MRMAHDCGAIALSVATGIMKAGSAHTLPANQRPHHLFDDLAGLAGIIAR
jgi:ribonucleotide monophosphatase NagD (HAD superfamily)